MKRVTENAIVNSTLGFRVYCDCYNAKKKKIRRTVQFRLGEKLKFQDTCMSFFIPLKCGPSQPGQSLRWQERRENKPIRIKTRVIWQRAQLPLVIFRIRFHNRCRNYLTWSLEQATILVTFHVLKHLSRYVHSNGYSRISHLKRESLSTLRKERRSTDSETLDRLVENV